MECDSKLYAIILWHVVSMTLNIGEKINDIRNNDIGLQKNLVCFQIYRIDVKRGVTLFTWIF